MTVESRAPDFLIVGAAKAGTTSVAAYLSDHPDVFVAPQKELYFFARDKVYARGWDWYRAQFAAAGDARAAGEATPDYMWRPEAVERIAKDLPQARLVAILRNPVDRAYSHYWHLRGYAAETRSFEESLADEAMEARVGYVSRGRYAEQLQRLYDRFPTDQVHVVLFDDLIGDPDPTFALLCQWLQVPVAQLGAPKEVHNQRFRLRSPRLTRRMVERRAWRRWPRLAHWADRINRVPVASAPMTPETRARLVEAFAPANAELSSLLGRDMSGWNR